jgi:hypothetical protein
VTVAPDTNILNLAANPVQAFAPVAHKTYSGQATAAVKWWFRHWWPARQQRHMGPLATGGPKARPVVTTSSGAA